jgi:hypothetical protein
MSMWNNICSTLNIIYLSKHHHHRREGGMVLMKILCKVISNVLDNQNSTCSIPINTVAYIVQTCLLLCTPSEDILADPNDTLKTNNSASVISLNIHQNSDILLQLLEVDSKLPPYMRNNLLHSLVFTYTIHIFNKSLGTSNGDGTAVGGEMLIWGLRALPYVLTGLTVTAPRTYGEFQDSDLAYTDATGIYKICVYVRINLLLVYKYVYIYVCIYIYL